MAIGDADIPAEFDAAYYRSAYPDLTGFSDEEVVDHYRRFGDAEGRAPSVACWRGGLLAGVVHREAGPVLEIGPYCNPCVHGANVAYLDIFPAAQLRVMAAKTGGDPAGCPETIDFVGDIADVDRRFELAVSSHAIEHQPDLVHHFHHVARVLEPGGHYCLLVPDRRYCFDALRPETTIGEVIEAHRAGRRRHGIASVIDEAAYVTHNDNIRHWAGDADEAPYRERLARICSAIAHFDAHDDYIDVHAWTFTPESFRFLTQTLFDLGLTGLRPARVYRTPHNSNEFCAVLTKAS